MRSVKINKIAAIGLLIILAVGIGQTTPPARPLEGDVEYGMYIKGGYPKIGDIFEIVFRVRLKENNQLSLLPEEIIEQGYIGGFSTGSETPLEITTKEIFIPTLVPGEWKEFSSQCIITQPARDVTIFGSIRLAAYKRGPILARDLWLLNPKTGQYGSRAEYEKGLYKGAEWWYDPAGEFTGDPVHPDCAKKNGEIIAKIQEINSNLTDWEALYLHYDGIQALMGGMGIQETTDEDRWRFLLDMGWLEQYKAGKAVKNKWLNKMIKKYKGKPLTKEQGFNPNFFRGDNWYSNSFFSYDSITKENLI